MKGPFHHPALRLALGLCLALAHAAFAAGVYYVDETARGPEDGLSWFSAYRTVAKALAERTGEFRVAAGVYTSPGADGIELGTNVLHGGYPNGGGERDEIANPSILDGGGTARIVKKMTPGRAALDGFTLQHGQHAQGGGALYASTGSLALAHCLFTGNAAPFAGAVWCSGDEASTFSNCAFTRNSADTAGNGLNNGGACAFTGRSTNRFEDCVFFANTSKDCGGALAGAGLFQLVRCAFTNNGAGQSGGALHGAIATMTDCSFAGNYDDEIGVAPVGGKGDKNRGWRRICGEGDVDVILDTSRGGAGRFRLTDGRVEVPSLAIGSGGGAGAGHLSQSGGTVRIAGGLQIGGAATGVYEVIGSAGVIDVGGTMSVGAKGTVALRPDGKALTLFRVGGAVTFAPGARLAVDFLAEPRIGDAITVIENASPHAVRGVFTDARSGAVLKQGAEFLARCGKGNVRLRISYGNPKAAAKGDQNVTLKVISVPAAPDLDSALGAGGITGTSAWLRASLVSTGDSASTVWCAWGPSDGATGVWANVRSLGVNTAPPPVACSNRVTGLITNGLYYYAFAASNRNSTVWSASHCFKTLSRPAVGFGSAAARTARNKAVLHGVLADGSQAEVTAFWGPSDGGTTPSGWACKNSLGLREEGPFTALAGGLTPGADYTCRFQARNEYGEAWTEAKTFAARDTPGPGRTWSGMGGADDRWTTDANWEGGAMPGKPATSAIVFNDTDAGRTNRVDEDWTLTNGLTVANNTVSPHTMDLGGHTLTLNGGTLTIGPATSHGNATFQNGTLAIGGATAANINLATANGTTGRLTINSAVSFKLGNVLVGQNTDPGGWNKGILDLRGSTPAQNTFSVAGSFKIGYQTWASTSFGYVYLNDAGGVITALEVGGNFDFYNGELQMKTNAAVTIGSNLVPVDMEVGYNSGSGDGTSGSTAIFAPTGAFTGYFAGKTVTIGATGGGTAGATGTLDLRNTKPTQNAFVVGTLIIGGSADEARRGTGHAYLNDKGGLIQTLQVKNLHFGRGTLELNTGANVILGNGAGDRGTLQVGRLG
ncbi:MAG: hypothetical protein WCI17_11530, partial [bacterium]